MDYDHIPIISFEMFDNPHSRDIYTAEFLEHVVQIFEKDANNLLDEISQAIDQQNTKNYADKLHALKGIASNMFAERLVALCKVAQSFPSDEQQFARANVHLLHLSECLQDTKKELARYIKKSAG